jgi:hypothetical protein
MCFGISRNSRHWPHFVRAPGDDFPRGKSLASRWARREGSRCCPYLKSPRRCRAVPKVVGPPDRPRLDSDS